MSGDDATTGTAINYQSAVLEKMYTSAFSDAKLAQLKADSEPPLAQNDAARPDHEAPSIQAKPTIDSLMLQALISKQALTPKQLEVLAQQRAERIYSYLLHQEAGLALQPERMQISAKPLVLSPDVAAVTCPLTLSAL